MNAIQSYRRARLFTAVNQSIQNFTRPARFVPAGLAALALAGMIPAASAQQPLEEIQVTGSRIVRSTMVTPTPVTAMDASELAAMAPGNLIDGLAQMPVFYGNALPDAANGGQNSGGSNVNLRGAGANRTLTLLNGRRVVPSNRFGSVDVSMFPEDLLRSVETVTGGASASYGTDAVAGVVNFILDTNYEGFKVHGQGGETEYGDGKTWETGIAFGHEFDNGIHVLGSLSAYDMAPIRSFSSLKDRSYLRNTARITNPDASGPTDIVRSYVRPTNFSNTGVMIDTSRPGLNRMEFQPDGTVQPMPFNGIGTRDTGSMAYADPANGYGVNSDRDLYSGYERQNGFLYLDYDIGLNTNVYGQAIYGQNRNSDRRESISLLSGWQGRVYADNAFLRPEVAQLIRDNGAEYVGYGFFPQNIVDSPLGESVQDTKNEMQSFTVGFEHDFTEGFLTDWNLQGYYQYGKNVQDFITLNGVRVDRLQLAMDAVADPVTGNPICRVNLPEFTGPVSEGGNGGLFADCVPLNTFGGITNMSRAAADYVMDRDNKIARQFTHQDMFELVLSGPISEGWGAGPIDAAFGVSYREEKFRQYTLEESDEYPALVDGRLMSDLGLLAPGLRGLVEDDAGGPAGVRFVPRGYRGDSNSSSVLFSSLRAMEGGYDVKEAFTEFNVPLLAGLPFMDSLESSLAARWADYEGSGDIWAWKVGLNWTINDELRVRATSSRDVRAASLRERFDQTRGGINVRNPWDNGALVSAASLSGGNPNVTPEEADTLTAGIVYQPGWLDGFSASLDWYSIDINDAIDRLAAQQIVDSCRLGDLSMCQYVITPNGPVTNPTGNDFRQIDRVDSLFINLANQRIEGMDVELRYRTDIDLLGGGAEQLSWRFLASYLGENSTQNPGAVRDERVGQLGTGFALPENKVTTSLTYMNGPYTGFLQARWIDGGVLDRTYMESNVAIPASQRPADSFLSLCNNGATICTIDDNSIPSIVYWDARIGASLGQDENLEIFLNINNLLDKEPPIAPGTIGRTGVGTGVGGLYDILGRNYTLGFNYEFAGF